MIIFYGIVGLFIAAILFVSLKSRVDVTGLTIAAGLAFGLIALFVLRRQNARKAKAVAGATGLLPSLEQAQKFMIIAGLGFVVMGVIEGLASLEPDTTRQPARLTTLLSTILGPSGPAVVYVAIGIAILIWMRERGKDRKQRKK